MIINEDIRAKEIRLIDEENNQLGIMATKEALNVAIEKGLDLVLISNQGNPPVCKLMDYGKYKYEMSKHKKEAKKKQKIVSIKELRMSPNIEQHDLNVRINQGRTFIQDGDKIKVSVRFRGREIAHQENGRVILEQIQKAFEDIAVVEKAPMMEGRSMVMFLAPKGAK